MVADLGNEKSSIEDQEDHSATAKVAVSDQALNDVMWALDEPSSYLAGSHLANNLDGYGVHEKDPFGALSHMVHSTHPLYPIISFGTNSRLPTNMLHDISAKEKNNENLLSLFEDQLDESQKSAYQAREESKLFKEQLDGTKNQKSDQSIRVLGQITKKYGQTIKPKLDEHESNQKQHSSLKEQREQLKKRTLREILVNGEGRNDIHDFSMLNETAQSLLDLPPADFQLFREANNKLDTLIRGTDVHLPTRWHFISYFLTAPFFRLGRFFKRCDERKKLAAQQSHGQKNKRISLLNYVPFWLGNWFGIVSFFMTISSAHSFSSRHLDTRKQNKQLKKTLHYNIRRNYIRKEPYGNLDEWAKCIDEYRNLPRSGNRILASLSAFLRGENKGLFADKKNKRDVYFQKLKTLLLKDSSDKNWRIDVPPAIPKASQVFWARFRRSKGHQILRDIRRSYLEKKLTIKAIDKGLHGVAMLRPSYWQRSRISQFFVALLRYPLMLLFITRIFGFWHRNNPVILARRSYKVWKSDVDSLLLTANAKANLWRRGIAQFKALAKQVNWDVPQLESDGEKEGEKFVDNSLKSDHANDLKIRCISEENITPVLKKLNKLYGKEVDKLKPTDERRQAYTNIVYGIAVKAPHVLLEDNPIVHVPDELLRKLVNANDGEARSVMIQSHNNLTPVNLMSNIAKILKQPTQQPSPEDTSASECTSESESDDESLKAVRQPPQSKKKVAWYLIPFSSKRSKKKLSKLKNKQKSEANVSSESNEIEILYSHREFLDISYNRAVRSLGTRIELLRSILSRLEALDEKAKVYIAGKSYDRSVIFSCLNACSRFAEDREKSQLKDNVNDLLTDLDTAIKQGSQRKNLGIEVTFSGIDSTLRRMRNQGGNFDQQLEEITLPLNESSQYVVHDRDLKILSDLENVDWLVQKNMDENICPTAVPAVCALWKDLSQDVMSIHVGILNNISETKSENLDFDSEEILQKTLCQIANDCCMHHAQDETSDASNVTISLKKSAPAAPDVSDSNVELKNFQMPEGQQAKKLTSIVMTAFKDARGKAERTFSLMVSFGEIKDKEVKIVLPELYMPSRKELDFLHNHVFNNPKFSISDTLEKTKIGGLLQAKLSAVAVSAPAKNDIERQKNKDNKVFFSDYLSLIQHTHTLTQQGDPYEKETLLLKGGSPYSLSKKTNQNTKLEYALFGRCILRAYTAIRAPHFKPIAYSFDVKPKLDQTIKRLINLSDGSEADKSVLIEFQSRLNLENTSPIESSFIKRVAHLLNFNSLQEQDTIFPSDKDSPLFHIVLCVLSESIVGNFLPAIGDLEALGNALQLLNSGYTPKQSCITAPVSSQESDEKWQMRQTDTKCQLAINRLRFSQNGRSELLKLAKKVGANYKINFNGYTAFSSFWPQLIKAYKNEFALSNESELVKTIKTYYHHGCAEEILNLLKHVCFDSEFMAVVNMSVNLLSDDAKNEGSHTYDFWSLLLAISNEKSIQTVLSIDRTSKQGLSLDSLLTMKGIAIQNDFGPAVQNLSSYVSGAINAKSTIQRTFVIPPVFRKVFKVKVLGESRSDKLKNLLNIIPNPRFKGLVISFKSLISYDDTNDLFTVKGLGIETPEILNNDQVTFNICDITVSHQDIASMLFANDDGNAIGSIFINEHSYSQASNAVNSPQVGWYDELKIELKQQSVNNRNRAWQNKGIAYLEFLLTTDKTIHSSIEDLRFISLFTGQFAHTYDFIENIIRTMQDISTLNNVGIVNADIKSLFALAARILPLIPEKARHTYYNRMMLSILNINQAWHKDFTNKNGESPIKIAEDVHLLFPQVKSLKAESEFYKSRVEILLQQSKKHVADTYNINLDKAFADKWLQAPKHIAVTEEFNNLTKVAKAALDANHSYLVRSFSAHVFGDTASTFSIKEHIALFVNQKESKQFLPFPNVLYQSAAWGFDMARLVRGLGLLKANASVKEAMIQLKMYQSAAITAILPVDKSVNFPHMIALTVMNRKLQGTLLNKHIEERISGIEFETALKEDMKILLKTTDASAIDDSSMLSFLNQITQSIIASMGPSPQLNANDQLTQLNQTVRCLQVALALGMQNLAKHEVLEFDDVKSNNELSSLKMSLENNSTYSDIVTQMRLCDFLSKKNDIKSHDPYMINIKKLAKQITQSAQQDIVIMTSNTVSDCYDKINLAVSFLAHLGFDDEAKRLIKAVFIHLLDTQHESSIYQSINMFDGEMNWLNHPACACLQAWAVDPIILLVVTSLDFKQSDWDNNILSVTEEGILALSVEEKNRWQSHQRVISKLILVAGVLLPSNPSNIDVTPSLFMKSAAHQGSLMVQKTMRFVHKNASIQIYTRLLESILHTSLVHSKNSWCLGLLATHYFDPLDKLMSDPKSSAIKLIANLQPMAIIFAVLSKVMEAKDEPNVLKLGMKLLQVLLARVLSPDFPDLDLLNKIEEVAFTKPKTQQKAQWIKEISVMAWDLDSMIAASNNIQNMKLMLDFSSTQAKLLKIEYIQHYGDPQIVGNVQSKCLHISSKTKLPVVPEFAMQLIRLITQVTGATGQFYNNAVGPMIPMWRGLKILGHLFESRAVNFRINDMTDAKRMDNCQRFGLLGPDFVAKIHNAINSKTVGQARNSVLPIEKIRKLKFSDLNDEQKSSVLELFKSIAVLNMPDQMLVFGFIPPKKFLARRNTDGNVVLAGRQTFFGGATLSNQKYFSELFYPICDQLVEEKIFSEDNNTIENSEDFLTVLDLMAAVINGTTNETLRSQAKARKRHQTVSMRPATTEAMVKDDSKLLEKIILQRLTLQIIDCQLLQLNKVKLEGDQKDTNKQKKRAENQKNTSFKDLIQSINSTLNNQIRAFGSEELMSYFRNYPNPNLHNFIKNNVSGSIVSLRDKLTEIAANDSDEKIRNGLIQFLILNASSGENSTQKTKQMHSRASWFKRGGSQGKSSAELNISLMNSISEIQDKDKVNSKKIKTILMKLNNIFIKPDLDKGNIKSHFSFCCVSSDSKKKKTKDKQKPKDFQLMPEITFNGALIALVKDGLESYLSNLKEITRDSFSKDREEDIKLSSEINKALTYSNENTSNTDYLGDNLSYVDKFTGGRVSEEIKTKSIELLIVMRQTFDAYNALYFDSKIRPNVGDTKKEAFDDYKTKLTNVYKFFNTHTIDRSQANWHDILQENRLLPHWSQEASLGATPLYDMAMKMRHAIPVPNALLLPEDQIDETVTSSDQDAQQPASSKDINESLKDSVATNAEQQPVTPQAYYHPHDDDTIASEEVASGRVESDGKAAIESIGSKPSITGVFGRQDDTKADTNTHQNNPSSSPIPSETDRTESGCESDASWSSFHGFERTSSC